MKFLLAIVLFLSALMPLARAQSDGDDRYITIYTQIQQGDTLVDSGQTREALPVYQNALAQLQKFKTAYPNWGNDIVSFRLGDLADKISKLQASAPVKKVEPVAANASPENPVKPDPQVAILQSQLQSARDENTQLQAKLKEALATQPAMVDAGSLVTAQAQILSLMKENDLLKACKNTPVNSAADQTIAQLRAQLSAAQQKPSAHLTSEAAAIAELNEQVKTLQARVAADEMKPAPFSEEELAAIRTGTNAAPIRKPVEQLLPAGTAELVASASAHFSKQEYSAAEADYQKILQHDENNGLTLANLAAIEMQENKLGAAEKHIQAALVQSPDDPYNLAMLGKIKFSQNKYDDALDALSRSAKIDPSNPETQNYLGVTLSQKGLRVPAEAALRKAIELDPNYAPAHNNLAMIYLSQTPSLPQLARWHYEKALAAGQPRNADLEKMLKDKGASVAP